MNFYHQCIELRKLYASKPIRNDGTTEVKILSKLMSIAFCNNDKLPPDTTINLDCSDIHCGCDEIQKCLKQILKDMQYHHVKVWQNHYSMCYQVNFKISDWLTLLFEHWADSCFSAICFFYIIGILYYYIKSYNHSPLRFTPCISLIL